MDTPLRGKVADFVQMDYTRDSVMPFVREAVGLAFCDQRTLHERDWVYGETVEINFPQGEPFLTATWVPEQKWHYCSDLSQDEIVIFNGCDTDPNAPGSGGGTIAQPLNQYGSRVISKAYRQRHGCGGRYRPTRHRGMRLPPSLDACQFTPDFDDREYPDAGWKVNSRRNLRDGTPGPCPVSTHDSPLLRRSARH